MAGKFIYVPGLIGIALLGLCYVLPILGILAGLFLLVAVYFTYARYLFAPKGKNLQEKIRNIVLSHLEWDGNGQALDIGCGSAALTIELAKKYPRASFIGIDSWGKSWEYSQQICEDNAINPLQPASKASLSAA